MRLHRRAYLARGLSVAAVAAVLALSATEEAEAQRRGGFGFSGARMNMGAQRPMMMRQSTPMMMRSTAVPRMTGARMVNPRLVIPNTARNGAPRWARSRLPPIPARMADGSRRRVRWSAKSIRSPGRPQAAEGPRGRREVPGARRRPSAALAWPLSASRLGAARCDRHWRCDRHGCRNRHRSRGAASAAPAAPSGGPAGPQISLAPVGAASTSRRRTKTASCRTKWCSSSPAIWRRKQSSR